MRRYWSLLILLPHLGWSAAPPGQTATNGGFAAQTSAGCTFGSPTTVGRLVVMGIYLQSTTVTITSITDAGGGTTWNTIGPAIGSNNETYIAWAVVTGTGFSSPNINFSGSTTGDVECAEYSGMAVAASVLDCNSAGSSGNSTALTSGACTTTAANDLIVGMGGTMANSTTYTAGSGFTVELNQAHSSQGNSDAFEDKNSSTCASTTASMTANTSGQWSMLMAAFKTSSPSACAAATNTLTIR